MVELKQLRCPSCHGDVPVTPGMQTALCEYCGSTVLVRQLSPAPATAPPSGSTELETLKLQLERAFNANQLVDARVLSSRLCRSYPTEWQGWLGTFKISLIEENQNIEARTLPNVPKPQNQFNNTCLEKTFAYMDEENRFILQNLITRRDEICQTLGTGPQKKPAKINLAAFRLFLPFLFGLQLLL